MLLPNKKEKRTTLVPPRFFPQFGICALPVLQRLLGRLHTVQGVTGLGLLHCRGFPILHAELFVAYQVISQAVKVWKVQDKLLFHARSAVRGGSAQPHTARTNQAIAPKM